MIAHLRSVSTVFDGSGRRDTRSVVVGSTCSMASLTRRVSIRPFFSRFSIREALEEPEERQAIVMDLVWELWSVDSRS